MTAHVPNPWTDDRVAVLRQSWVDGLTCSQIAAVLDCGITRNAVIGKANRLGLSERKRKPSNPRPLQLTREEKARRQQERALARLSGLQPPPFRRVKFKPAGPPPESLHVGLLDLHPKACRFPEGDGPYLFCGQPVRKGSSYCEHCHALTHQRQTAPSGHFRQRGWGA